MLFWLGLACSSDKVQDTAPVEQNGWRPAQVCPGDAGCEGNDGALYVGASAKVITPTCFEQWEDVDGNHRYTSSTDIVLDCGCDQLCPGDEGYQGPDEGEGDGLFEAIWLAGYSSARPANYVHDDVWARTVVFQQGDVDLALVSVDLVGFFRSDVDIVQERLRSEIPELDYILISSTHVHSGPDVMGQWGRIPGTTGRNERYQEELYDFIVEGVVEAWNSKQEATMSVGSVDTSTYSAEKGSRNLIHDHRDPKIIDPDLGVAHFVSNSGETIATVVNYGNHPEVLTSRSLGITSDFVDATRRGVENGISYPDAEIEGVGGVCVYVSAAVGGMMSPLQVEVTDGSGNAYRENTFEKSDALGNVMAELTLQAVASAEPVENPQLAFAVQPFDVPIENILFQAAFQSGMFDRSLANYEDGEILDPYRTPMVTTEIAVLDVGNVRMQTVPGELLPELAIGGYDDPAQPHTPLEVIVGEDNPNPPDLSQAPEGPYIKDRMAKPHNWIVGLGNDELGYFVPSYNYQLDETSPYLNQAEGDHYEETNSLGPSAYPIIETEINRLLDWVNQ